MNEASSLSMRDRLVGMLSRKKLTDDLLVTVADNVVITLIKSALQGATAEDRTNACELIFDIVDNPGIDVATASTDPGDQGFPSCDRNYRRAEQIIKFKGDDALVHVPNGSPFDSANYPR